MTHAWCNDIARDAAVRAAEDGRTGPLATLEEAIVLAFGFDKASAQRACDEVNSWPEDVQKDCRCVLGDLLEQGVDRLQALVEAWRYGKGLLAARYREMFPNYPAMIPKSVSATSAVDHGNKGDGMATDGLRTERVVLEVTHDSHLSLRDWPSLRTFFGESVRVVDTHAEAVAESVAWEGARDAYRERILRLTAERDAAIRERDELRRALIVENHDALRIKAERDAAIRERDTLKARLKDSQNCSGKFWSQILVVASERDVLKARVAELEAATGGNCSSQPYGSQAASGGGEGEPVALSISPAERDGLQVIVDGVIRHGNGVVVIPGSDSLRAVESLLARHTTAPPQPRGWLRKEEREAVEFLASLDAPPCIDAARKAARIGKALLARSSPPEVVLPPFKGEVTGGPWAVAGYNSAIEVCREALAAAGVAVKEVG
jgi:hypothetical protein